MLAKCSNRCESGQEVVRVEDGYFSQTEQTEGKGEGSGETIRGNACIVKGSGACRADTDRAYRFPLALSRYNR